MIIHSCFGNCPSPSQLYFYSLIKNINVITCNLPVTTIMRIFKYSRAKIFLWNGVLRENKVFLSKEVSLKL